MDGAELVAAGAAALVQAMTTETWNTVRARFADLFGANRDAAMTELSQAREEIADGRAPASDVEAEWRNRLRRLLGTNPHMAQELRTIMDEIAPAVRGGVSNTIQGGVSGIAVQARTVRGGVVNTTYGGDHVDLRGTAASAVRSETEAALVQVKISSPGGLQVKIVNHGSRPVLRTELVDIRRGEAAPGESWKPNPNTSPITQPMKEILAPAGGTHQIFVWLLDEKGRHITSVVRHLEYVVRFRDYDGQWWHRDGSSEPRRVSDPGL